MTFLSIVVGIVAVIGLVYTVKSFRRAGPRVVLRVKKVEPLTPPPEMTLLVQLKLFNRGLAPVNIDRIEYNVAGYRSELIGWDVNRGSMPAVGTRIEGGCCFDFTADVYLPMFISFYQVLEKMTQGQRITKRQATRGFYGRIFKGDWSKAIVVELGNGSTAELEHGLRLQIALFRFTRQLFSMDPDDLNAALEKRLTERLNSKPQISGAPPASQA